MKEVKGDIWDYHKRGYWIVITTNGTIRSDGCAVMGRGVAKQASEKYTGLPRELGLYLRWYGNVCHAFGPIKIITFPVKHHWNEKADINLITKNCIDLSRCTQWMDLSNEEKIYMVRPGCGNGRLDWKDIKPILEKYLDDRFVVVELHLPLKSGRYLKRLGR